MSEPRRKLSILVPDLPWERKFQKNQSFGADWVEVPNRMNDDIPRKRYDDLEEHRKIYAKFAAQAEEFNKGSRAGQAQKPEGNPKRDTTEGPQIAGERVSSDATRQK